MNMNLTEVFLFYLPAQLHHDADDLDGERFYLGGGVDAWRIRRIGGAQLQAAVPPDHDLFEGGFIAVDKDGTVVAVTYLHRRAEDAGNSVVSMRIPSSQLTQEFSYEAAK